MGNQDQPHSIDDLLVAFWVGAVIFGCVSVTLIGLIKALTFLALAFFF